MGLSGTRKQENGEKYIKRNLTFCFVTQYCVGDKIEKKGMGEACSAYGEGEEFEGV